MFVRIIIAVISLLLAACSPSPKNAAYDLTTKIGCTVGNGDAIIDIKNKTFNDGYYPKEDFKIFSFNEYKVPDDEKEGFKQLFRLSARGCYITAVRKAEEENKKKK